MDMDLKPFMPSSVCLSCEGCCRFPNSDSVWRPHAGKGEREAGPAGPDIQASLDASGSLMTRPEGGAHACVFLKTADNTCNIYSARPFECALYPFVLTPRGKEIEVSVHLSCPYVQDVWDSSVFEEYVAYLKSFFEREDVRDFLKDNPYLIRSYPNNDQELENVFII